MSCKLKTIVFILQFMKNLVEIKSHEIKGILIFLLPIRGRDKNEALQLIFYPKIADSRTLQNLR